MEIQCVKMILNGEKDGGAVFLVLSPILSV